MIPSDASLVKRQTFWGQRPCGLGSPLPPCRHAGQARLGDEIRRIHPVDLDFCRCESVWEWATTRYLREHVAGISTCFLRSCVICTGTVSRCSGGRRAFSISKCDAGEGAGSGPIGRGPHPSVFSPVSPQGWRNTFGTLRRRGWTRFEYTPR